MIISMLVGEFLAKNKTVNMCKPPYTRDLDPSDFFLFPKRKAMMKGEFFATIEEIKEKSKSYSSSWRYQKAHFRRISELKKTLA